MLKKILITLFEIALIVLVVAFIATALNSVGFAEDLWEAYVVCQPGDYVNVRLNPSRKSEAVGYADAGDSIMIDGAEKNGYLRCYYIGEMGVGWIHKGYVVYDKLERVSITAKVNSKGRVMARKYVGGKRRAWLKKNDEVKVYWLSMDWCVTNKGFVKTKYLEME